MIVIGGGASGIICAIKAAEKHSNKKITIIEKQPKIGRKLLSTGNGRCNFTNINSTQSCYHGSFSSHIDFLLNRYSPKDIIEIFKSYGLISRIESDGRVYPYSNHASSLLDILRFRLESLGVEVVCDTAVRSVVKNKDNYQIKTDSKIFTSEKVVFSTGSKASKKLGGDASGIDILNNLGHKIVPLSPALCPIKVDCKYLPSLKGIRSKGKVTLICDGKIIREESGEIQFTQEALSGICVFNLATYINNVDNAVIRVSLMPEYSEDEIISMLFDRRKSLKKRQSSEFLVGIFHKSLASTILKESIENLTNKSVSDISDKEIRKLAYKINNLDFKVTGKLDFINAQVVSGGVVGDEIDFHTMESKINKNLFICGEAVDINGDCGGYNLQFAFSSGLLAGENL